MVRTLNIRYLTLNQCDFTLIHGLLNPMLADMCNGPNIIVDHNGPIDFLQILQRYTDNYSDEKSLQSYIPLELPAAYFVKCYQFVDLG